MQYLTSPYTLAILATAGALILWLRGKIYPKPFPGIPYNPDAAKRLWGDLPDLMPAVEASHSFSESMFSLTTRKLRVPIAQLLFPEFLRKPMVVLDDPREVEDIMLRRNKLFDKTAMTIDILSPMFGNAFVAMYNTPAFREQKRLWADAMGPEFLRKTAAPSFVKTALATVKLWKIKASTAPEEPFETLEDFKRVALDAIWVVACGEDPGIVQHEISKAKCKISGDVPPTTEPPGLAILKEVKYITDTIARNTTSPSPKWAQRYETWTPRWRASQRVLKADVGRALRRAIERFQDVELGNLDRDDLDTCMVDLVLRRQFLDGKKAGKSKKQMLADLQGQDRELNDVLVTMLFGGFDSTAHTLAWFVRFMEANPSVQSELRDVLQSAFAGNKTPSAEEILQANIPYLDAVCEESYRLAGAAKATLRQTLEDVEILGCTVPKGTEVYMNLHIDRDLHAVDESRRSPSSRDAAAKFADSGGGIEGRAGRDLGAFEPRRWLVTDEAANESFNANAMQCLAFGGGSRACFGVKFIRVEFRILIVILILNFEFLSLPEELRTPGCIETMFCQPAKPYARVRVL